MRRLWETQPARALRPTPNHALVVPQISRPGGAFQPFDGTPLTVTDGLFRPQKVTATVARP